MMEQPFMDYWPALDAALLSLYDIDTEDMGLSAAEIAAHQKAGELPIKVARHYGRKYDLRTV